MNNFPRLDSSVWKLMTKRQRGKYRKYGVIPKWVKRVDFQLSSRPLDKPRTGNRRNAIEELWDNVSLNELNR